MMRDKKIVWVVTYCDNCTEPVVTVFDNLLSAGKCYNYFQKYHDVVCIDECFINSNFLVCDKNDI